MRNIPHQSQGMTFIEVIVALFIIVTGILGAAAMQATAKKGSFDAMQRSLASALAQDIIERMRSNAATLDTLESYEGDYGATVLSAPDLRCFSPSTLCDSTEMKANDVYEWAQLIRGAESTIGTTNTGGLVNARGCISHTDFSVTVVVSWEGKTEISDASDSDKGYEGCGIDNDKRRQVLVEAFIY